MNTDADRIDGLICAALRGEYSAWPAARGVDFIQAFLRRSDYQGVLPLLNESLHRLESWPVQIRHATHSHVIVQAIWELCHQQVLARVLAAFADVGIQPVLLKGTALAYSLYPNPILRSRGDTDMLIPSSKRKHAHDVLTSLGLEPWVGTSGEYVSYQRTYTFTTSARGTHSIDLHWKINNSELLSRLFSYDELLEQSVPLANFCPCAISVGRVHALLIACMHRATHWQNPYYVDGIAHYSADRLIWLYDIHLLATASTADQWQHVVRLATEKGLCATCLDGIRRANLCFKTCCPSFVLENLAASGARERIPTYLNGSKMRQQWMDFCALDGLMSKMQFLKELIFPPAAYMRSKYPAARTRWLPLLYAHRALGGVVKRLRVRRTT